MDRGTRARSKYGESRSVFSGAGWLILLPWLIFTLITLLYFQLFHHAPEVVYLVIVGCLSIAGMTFSFTGRSEGRWYMLLGTLVIFATIAGTLGGEYNHREYMLQYYNYHENREYSNVIPSEPAAAHADAGKITFADNARIDTTRAVGYKDGTVYCVAPILDETMAGRVEYWAAGTNCCKTRADFECDASADPTARSGVVIAETGSWFETDRDYYLKAVGQAEAAFDLVSSPKAIFVKWVANPLLVEQAYYKEGEGVMLAGAAMYLVLSIILGVVAGISSRR